MTSLIPSYNDEYSQVSFCPSTLVDCLSCILCKGLFRDAITSKECLHTFCRSCVHKYMIKLENKNTDSNTTVPLECPQCKVQLSGHSIDQAYRPDHTLQDLVNKCFPEVIEQDKKEEEEFYKSRGNISI